MMSRKKTPIQSNTNTEPTVSHAKAKTKKSKGKVAGGGCSHEGNVVGVVTLFGHEIPVSEDESLFDRGCWGEYDPSCMTIFIYPHMPQSKRREVLIHETLHAIEDVLGKDMDHPHLRAIAHGLGQALTPWLKKI